jgi:hypothetical protein
MCKQKRYSGTPRGNPAPGLTNLPSVVLLKKEGPTVNRAFPRSLSVTYGNVTGNLR